jgi:hypothetical protein
MQDQLNPHRAQQPPHGGSQVRDVNVQYCRGLVINAPELFEDPAFMAWLNSDEPKFTWHTRGDPVAGEYSDVVISVDPSLSGEGTDTTMPDAIWAQLVDACRDYLGVGVGEPHFMIRITNLR